MSLSNVAVPRPDDASVRLLDTLFGTGWEALVPGEGATEAANILFNLLGYFNTIAMAAIAVLWVWIMTRGVIGTAHEGRPLGRAYHTFWTPLRLAFANALIAPVGPGGISLMQMGLLWTLAQSIALANTGWALVLDKLVDSGGMIVAEAPASVEESTRQVAGGILRARTWARAKALSGEHEEPGALLHYEFVPSGDGGAYVLTFLPSGGYSPGEFGRIHLPCPGGQNEVCQTRLAALTRLAQEMDALAARLADPALEMPSASDFLRAVEAHDAAVVPRLGAWLEAQDSQLVQDLRQFAAQAKTDGWAAAGSYYWTISRLHERARRVVLAGPTMQEPNIAGIAAGYPGDLVPEALSRADSYWEMTQAGRIAAARTGGGDAWNDQLFQFFGRAVTWQVDAVARRMGSGDPVITLADLGGTIITGGMMAGTGYLGAVALTGAAQGHSDSLAGKVVGLVSLGTTSAAVASAAAVVREIGGIVRAALISLMGLGFFLAYYLPSIPYILWICAVVSWLVVVVESLVAAPLWVAAHALPEGEGLAGERAKQGYMLFLGILIRPMLMVAGLVAALALIKTVGAFVGAGFSTFAAGLSVEDPRGLISTVALTVILGGLFVVLSHKIFGLITWLPERVICWIGQQRHDLGEASDEARTSHTFAGVITKSEGAANAGGRAGGAPGGQPAAPHGLGALKISDADLAMQATATPQRDRNDSTT